MENIRRPTLTTTQKLRAAQLRYKADFDNRVSSLQRPEAGNMVCMQREAEKDKNRGSSRQFLVIGSS